MSKSEPLFLRNLCFKYEDNYWIIINIFKSEPDNGYMYLATTKTKSHFTIKRIFSEDTIRMVTIPKKRTLEANFEVGQFVVLKGYSELHSMLVPEMIWRNNPIVKIKSIDETGLYVADFSLEGSKTCEYRISPNAIEGYVKGFEIYELTNRMRDPIAKRLDSDRYAEMISSLAFYVGREYIPDCFVESDYRSIGCEYAFSDYINPKQFLIREGYVREEF